MANKPKTRMRLAVQPIPGPLHRVNLRAVLTQHQWRKLRQSIIDERGSSCESCGKQVETIYAHEEWAYDVTKKPAVATIRKISLNCWHCHACEHFIHTVVMTREGHYSEEAIQEVVDHFCAVNGTDENGFRQHVEESMAEWRRLSDLEWRVDFRPFADVDAVQVTEAEEKPPTRKRTKARKPAKPRPKAKRPKR